MRNAKKAFVASQKRRLADRERTQTGPPPPTRGQPKPKQRKTERPSPQPSPPQGPQNLLGFCDELLYEIFKYLDSASIMAVMHCAPRFESLLLDHRFWHNIDLSNAPLPMGILEDILGRATEKTHTIKICGPPSSQHVVGEFKQFTCTLTSIFPKVATQLKVLELQGVSLDFEYIHISEFPASLKRLTLKDCSVKVGDHVKSIFHTIEKQLVHLEDLSIEDNNWFEPYYIMALSKLPSLRRLSLKGCELMCKFVPYGSMAARFGFQKLEILDLRLTPINNSDLQCFSAIEGLRELLLESPPDLKHRTESTAKTSNGKGTSNEEPHCSKSEKPKTFNDDEPSTSRAAMEHMRACNIGQNEDTPAGAAKPSTKPFNSGNCNQKKEPPGFTNTGRRLGGVSSESDDEDTSSTSASSSDKSDNATARNSRPDAEGNRTIPAPLVVIAMPGVGRNRSPAPAENAENVENPEPAAAAGPAPPRAIIYLPNGEGADGQRPQGMASFLEQMVDQIHTFRNQQSSHSRLMPRRDQVIYMNPQAMAEPLLVMHSRRHRTQPRGNFEQVVHHPMFWNMLDPLDRDFARRMRSRPPPPSALPPQYFVSDRAIYSFGRASNPVQPEVVWIRNSNRSPNNRLERILLRNYPHITNFTLEHLLQCSPNLIYIDVSGTAVTLMGLRNFRRHKPNCQVIASHLNNPEHQTSSSAPSTAPSTTPSTPSSWSFRAAMMRRNAEREQQTPGININIDNEQSSDEQQDEL